MGYLFSSFEYFLERFVNLELFNVAVASMSLCAVVGLLIYVIRWNKE